MILAYSLYISSAKAAIVILNRMNRFFVLERCEIYTASLKT